MAGAGVVAVLTGSYTPDTGGEGVGVTALRLTPGDGAPSVVDAVAASGASYLAAHPTLPVVYTTHESTPGAVSAFGLREGAAPLPLGAPLTSGGANPCHLTVHPGGEYLLTANYGTDTLPGTVAVHRLDADGRLVDLTDVVEHKGSGPVTGRQEGTHAHQVVVDPAGRYILATDLGADTVFTYELDTDAGKLKLVSASQIRPGSGPRHLAFAPSGDLVISADELSSTVTCHRYDAETGTLHELSRVPATAVADIPNQPGGIVTSDCGRYVWVTNRGADTVAAFRITGAELAPLGEVPSGGSWPRGLTAAPGCLLVANQHSGTVAVLGVSGDGSLVEAGAAVVAVASVVCALAV
ncbi:lactonase family protein [Streptomyces sp. N50]|uniref:lactonase family protein n=1 Tax=Streptomyces sp. N50 TaxID=3081765 RepID=UPI0029623A78|nr:lactonase family protein [Streptomyces sp. N50]WOX11156.1 lactonase family protein [Streptomyces sp. N50]